ncbi:MAG TPA: sigma-70 family RNA polymerase sigma factor [Acidimicrobiales bacterium]|nr:sigma-70 family RNA polymerase sigma factor [Acidimicrobiales bacterium]
MAATAPDHAAERLHRYCATRDERLREELVREHTALARAIARRFAGRGEPLDELTQVALIALSRAIERYDPSRGTAFDAYAQATIVGELKRHFRTTWRLRVPRSLQELYLDVRSAVDALDQELGRSPTIPEIAEYAGITEEAVVEAMEVGRNYRLGSLEAGRFGDEAVELPEFGHEDKGLQFLEDRNTVAFLLEGLPERERAILRLRFWEELSQSEIAVHMQVSQMHVSRLLSRSLARLRTVAEQSAQAGAPAV